MEILKKSKVIVAMSGGVDSSVAAVLAKEAACEVIGVTLKLKHPDEEFSAAQHCASKNDEEATDSLVKMLEIKHFYLDGYADFEQKVLRYCADEYMLGRTPNPCCLCNKEIKFGKLLEFAKEVDADYIMTGHYAKILEIDNCKRLQRGDDLLKDQTYFLYNLSREELAYLQFPIGELTKDEVRKIAAQYNLITADKPDSQDACFSVDGEVFPETLRRLFKLKSRRGVITYDGKVVGRHDGFHKYTIGQRKGLNVALGVPAYVRKIDAQKAEVELVTDSNKLLSDSFRIKSLNFHADNIADEFEAKIQIRYRSKPTDAKIKRVGADEFLITPVTPLRAVTAGQAGVIYENDILLGGGIIDVD